MGSNLKRVFGEHKKETSKNPRLNFAEIEGVKYIHEFDRAVQAPIWGYPTEGAYYRDASSIDSLLAVKIPLFAINAKDDPVGLSYPIYRAKVDTQSDCIQRSLALSGNPTDALRSPMYHEFGGSFGMVRALGS